MAEEKKREKIKRKLTHNYRLVISSEDTWEEKFSLRLNRLNVFVVFGLISFFLIVSTTIFIAFTPLKEYIPGYDSSKLRQESQNLIFKTDSLNNIISKNQVLVDNLSRVLSGDIDTQSLYIEDDSIKQEKAKTNINIDLSPSKEDSIFRLDIERADRYNIIEKKDRNVFILTSPIQGKISQKYNVEQKHFAIDIATAAGTPVKSVADGTIIFSEWTSLTGTVIIIEHNNNLISVYKHNSTSSKNQGDFVEKGEVIATSGSTGELSTGPHLHFELWYDGYPVNPTDYIDFEL